MLVHEETVVCCGSSRRTMGAPGGGLYPCWVSTAAGCGLRGDIYGPCREWLCLTDHISWAFYTFLPPASFTFLFIFSYLCTFLLLVEFSTLCICVCLSGSFSNPPFGQSCLWAPNLGELALQDLCWQDKHCPKALLPISSFWFFYKMFFLKKILMSCSTYD